MTFDQRQEPYCSRSNSFNSGEAYILMKINILLAPSNFYMEISSVVLVVCTVYTHMHVYTLVTSVQLRAYRVYTALVREREAEGNDHLGLVLFGFHGDVILINVQVC